MSRGPGRVMQAVRRALSDANGEWVSVTDIVLAVYPDERHTEGHRYSVRRALTAMRVPVDGIRAELDGSGPDLRARADFTKATEQAVRTHRHRGHLPNAPTPAKLTGWAECSVCDCAEYVPGQEVPYVGICCGSCSHVRRDHRQVSGSG